MKLLPFDVRVDGEWRSYKWDGDAPFSRAAMAFWGFGTSDVRPPEGYALHFPAPSCEPAFRVIESSFAEEAAHTLLWSETRDDMPLEDDFDVDDLKESDGWVRFVIVCEDFLSQADELLDGEYSQAAHDFILSANGHGAGFWDGDWPEHGDALHELAKPHGPIHLDVGDKGELYFAEV